MQPKCSKQREGGGGATTFWISYKYCTVPSGGLPFSDSDQLSNQQLLNSTITNYQTFQSSTNQLSNSGEVHTKFNHATERQPNQHHDLFFLVETEQ